MKTTRILLISLFLLFPWCAAQLFSQSEGAKKITITKHTVDADGSESTETIVKKGAAAENFDVEKYIRDNRGENTQVEVKVTEGDDERSIVVKGPKSVRTSEADDEEEDDEEGNGYGGYGGYSGYEGYSGYNICKDNGAFLGVNEDSDEDSNQPGLVVNVIRGSAADKAGLRDNDKITKVNEAPTNKWSDLTKIVNALKPGDKVRIAYERNGKGANTEATLSTQNAINSNVKCEEKGFLGVSDMENRRDTDNPGVAVSIIEGSSAKKAGLKNGDVIFQLGDTPIADFEDISDFMAYTKPGDKVNLVYERNGQRKTVEVTLAKQENSWSINSVDWDLSNLDQEEILEKAGLNKGNCTVNVRAKDACLGVFSDAYAEGNAVGARINDFTEASAALEANMAKGDIITAINGQQIEGHDDLWNEIAKYTIGEAVKIQFLREGQSKTVEVMLKACQDASSRVQIMDGDGEQVRDFTSWNWTNDDQRRLRERNVITIRRGEGDAPIVNALPNNQAQDRSLKLIGFRAYPNPTQGQMTVEFSSDPVATTVTFFDLAGRQLFREELNVFDGRYNQQFDLSEYSKGAIVVHVQQGEKVFTEQIMVN